MDKDLREKLLSLLRLGMGVSDESVAVDQEEGNRLLEISKRHCLVPIIYRGLQEASVAEDILKQFDISNIKSISKSVVLDAQTKTLCSIFETAQIPYILLKGSVLKYLYPESTMRTSGDIDILVREIDIDKAIEAIREETDFITGARNYHDVSMHTDGIVLELHFSLKENMSNVDTLLEKAWEYAAPKEGCFQQEFTPEFQIFHVLAHMSYHISHGGLGIRPFLDLWLLCNKTNFDNEKLRTLLTISGLLKFYEKSLSLVNSWMTGNSLLEDLVPLEEFCFSGGVFGTRINAALAESRNRDKKEYIFKRLFVNREYLEGLYPNLKNKTILLPYYQIKRWFRLVNRNDRKRAREELQIAINSSAEDVDSLNSLLSDLGL